jgi:hypothetical protein
MKKKTIIIFLILFPVFSAAAGYNFLQQEEKHSIDIRRAKIVKTDITFPAGKLYINTRADAFCEGVFRYRERYWKPVIYYEEDSGIGRMKITVDDDRDSRSYNDSDRNEWILGFNREIRNEMKIEMVAGESEIDLEGASLERFDFRMVGGESYVNLRNTSVPFLSFRAVAGEAEIDLSGTWKNDLDAEIRGGVGELTLILPADVGIKLQISGGLGEISAPAFDKDGRTYTNDRYGRTRTSLYLDIKGGIGNVNIRVAR